MKRNCRYGKLLFVVCCLLLAGCNDPAKQQITPGGQKSEIYYCPMHPEVQQDHPGECPKCGGMKLVSKDPANFLDVALKPTSSNIISKIHIIKPEYKKLPVVVSALGYIDYDINNKTDISSRYTGRIEKLYVKYNYQPIKKGDPIFDIYSPDLVTAQENLIYLLKTSPEENNLIDAARQKLKLLQLTDDQIKGIESSQKVKNSMTVFSKYDGHVHEMLGKEMEGQKMSDYAQTPLISVREGMYVERGMVLFNVVNPRQIVAMLKIKTADIGKVHKSQVVTFYLNNDSTAAMSGTIDFIEPVFNNKSKSMMVRVNINNGGHKHKVGSLVNAKIMSDSLETLWVPSSAIVDLGMNNIVWKWRDGHFKASKVETGIKVNSWVEIADGLTESDEIASEAHYLSDSEGFIKINEDDE